tara:strand:- start:1528 stop:3036 length:1509 start_codon:yes stop_codon:yes gene_type:complete
VLEKLEEVTKPSKIFRNIMDYFKSLKKFKFIFLTFYILGCSNQVTISDDSYIIKNISIIDPIDGLQSTKSLVITDNTISMILDNDNELIDNNNIIDASGKYLIPGLWDAHIHFSFDTDLAPFMPGLFLAHGVTSVRDTGGPIDLVVKMKDLSLNDPINNPTVYIAGPLIDGTPNVYNNSSPSFPLLSIENSDIIDIESNVQEILDEEVDLLKAYEMLTENQFLALMRIAKTNNLNVTGHIPLSMTLFSAIDSGLNGIEHLRNFALSIASNSDELFRERLQLLKNPDDLPGSDLRSLIHSKQRMRALDSIDYDKFEEAAILLASRNVWQTPTLFLYRNSSQKIFKDPSFINELNKLPTQIKEKWIKEISDTDTIVDKNSLRYSNWLEEASGKLHKKNVPFMAGTDTPIGYLIPGRSLHIELEVMVENGFSNLEAIRAATLNPATFFGLENKVGRIKNGYKADLVILNSNPLENIRNTQDISMVIKNGYLLSRKSLDSLMYKKN